MRTAVLRIFHVHVGHVAYTRVQLLHVLVTSLSVDAFLVSLFSGREAETCNTLASFVALCAVATGSIASTVGRIVFKLANQSNKHSRRVYKTNKHTRQAANGQYKERGKEGKEVPAAWCKHVKAKAKAKASRGQPPCSVADVQSTYAVSPCANDVSSDSATLALWMPGSSSAGSAEEAEISRPRSEWSLAFSNLSSRTRELTRETIRSLCHARSDRSVSSQASSGAAAPRECSRGPRTVSSQGGGSRRNTRLREYSPSLHLPTCESGIPLSPPPSPPPGSRALGVASVAVERRSDASTAARAKAQQRTLQGTASSSAAKSAGGSDGQIERLRAVLASHQPAGDKQITGKRGRERPPGAWQPGGKGECASLPPRAAPSPSETRIPNGRSVASVYGHVRLRASQLVAEPAGAPAADCLEKGTAASTADPSGALGFSTADPSGALGFNVRTLGGAAPREATFVRATRIDRTAVLPWLSLHPPSHVDVTFERSRLPAGVVDVTPAMVSTPIGGGDGEGGNVLEWSRMASAGVVGAFALNSFMLWASFVALLSIVHARAHLADNLRASALDNATWWAQVRSAFGFSIFYSFLLIDGVKVVCLTLTSKPALAALGLPSGQADKEIGGGGGAIPRRSRSLATEVTRKTLRRFHKVLDFLS